MPAPSVSGVILPCSAVSWSISASTTGQTCTQTWFMSSAAPGRAALGARPPDRLEAVLDGPLRVREGGDRAVGVADDGELAHLRERDQSLVGRVVPGPQW